MPTDWSEDIVIAELADEPALSDELTVISDRLAAAVSAGGSAPSVVLNFSRVTYINSSNIAQLLRVRKQLAEAGSKLRLCSISDEVWSVMLITGLDKVFEYAPDPMTALASLQIEGES
ncbi:MAG: STAS domain-containing protein [Planctomycetota bacterium]